MSHQYIFLPLKMYYFSNASICSLVAAEFKLLLRANNRAQFLGGGRHSFMHFGWKEEPPFCRTYIYLARLRLAAERNETIDAEHCESVYHLS